MIRLNVRGAGLVAAELKNIGQRVVDNARKTMHAAAERIVHNARLNAPVDDHDLEQSIHAEKSYEGPRGRLKYDIVAGGVVNGVDVDDYAALIHENYSSMQPGPGTVAKQAANPGRLVGEKFLERALEEEAETLQGKLIAGTQRVIRQ